MKKIFALIAAAFFATAAYGQSSGTVTNHAYAIGKGAGVAGYTSLLCASGQLAIGSATDPTCRTMSADATLSAAGVLTLATVNANTGVWGSTTQVPQFTVNGKGLITAVSNVVVTPAVGSIAGLGTNVATALGVNVGTAGAFVVNGGALGTPSSGVATNLTGTAAGLTAGTVTTNANLTGVVTSVGNATSIANNAITRAMEAQGVARSVIGVTGNATANVADIQGTANQFLGVNSAGTALAFNTLSQDCTLATAVITCTKTNNVAFTSYATAAIGQLPGTTTNDNAAAGDISEYVECVLVTGSASALVTSTPKTICTLAIPSGGDWEVDTSAYFNSGGTTQITSMTTSMSLVTNTLDLTAGRWGQLVFNLTGPPVLNQNVPNYRFSLAGATSIFLVVQSTFTVSTEAAWGIIRARRAR